MTTVLYDFSSVASTCTSASLSLDTCRSRQSRLRILPSVTAVLMQLCATGLHLSQQPVSVLHSQGAWPRARCYQVCRDTPARCDVARAGEALRACLEPAVAHRCPQALAHCWPAEHRAVLIQGSHTRGEWSALLHCLPPSSAQCILRVTHWHAAEQTATLQQCCPCQLCVASLAACTRPPG